MDNITRIWHGRTSLANADSYLQFLLTDGTREYLQTEGNLSVKVMRRLDNDCCHFWTVTEWKDIESVKAFAGEEEDAGAADTRSASAGVGLDRYRRAKYYPEDQGVLLEFEEHVMHCEGYRLFRP